MGEHGGCAAAAASADGGAEQPAPADVERAVVAAAAGISAVPVAVPAVERVFVAVAGLFVELAAGPAAELAVELFVVELVAAVGLAGLPFAVLVARPGHAVDGYAAVTVAQPVKEPVEQKAAGAAT